MDQARRVLLRKLFDPRGETRTDRARQWLARLVYRLDYFGLLNGTRDFRYFHQLLVERHLAVWVGEPFRIGGTVPPDDLEVPCVRIVVALSVPSIVGGGEWESMSRYSNELKASVLRRMMPPENRTVVDLSQETGITQQTLYGWRRSARARGIAVPGNGEPAEQWSSAEKFRVVLETAHLTEVALAEYCRSRGLYVEQVGQWRHACEQGNARAEEASQLDRGALRQVRKRNLDLEKELRRKDKALAELAALLVLTKKLEAFRNNRENEDA